MQNPEDFPKLKANDSSFYKLFLHFKEEDITNGAIDWYDLRTAIENNTVVREVHLTATPEFVEQFPLSQLNQLCQAIGNLPNLKYVMLGQMTGDVVNFGQLPLNCLTTLASTGAGKVQWFVVRGLILTHIYKGSEEEAEDKSGDLSVSQHRSTREKAKEKKKKDKKHKKEHKKKSSSSKKESDSKISATESNNNKLDKKQAAAKRAMEKFGDALVQMRHLKKFSVMGHLDEILYGCPMDALLEGLSPLEELEFVNVALTRHEGKISVDPTSLGSFLDACPALTEASVLYTQFTDDHLDEIAGAVGKAPKLKELTLSGEGSTTPEPIGLLIRTNHLSKLVIKELTLDDQCMVAMCIGLAHKHNLSHVEVQCQLTSKELLALQQMILCNAGLECLHLHLTVLESVSYPLDLLTSIFGNPQSKLTKIVLESDKVYECQKLKEVNLTEWQEVIDGIFKVSASETVNSNIITMTKV